MSGCFSVYRCESVEVKGELTPSQTRQHLGPAKENNGNFTAKWFS